jgi:hypothetical protein
MTLRVNPRRPHGRKVFVADVEIHMPFARWLIPNGWMTAYGNQEAWVGYPSWLPDTFFILPLLPGSATSFR